jgi:hypothetical protein
MTRSSVAAAAALAVFAGCGSSPPRSANSDPVKATFLRGVQQIRDSQDRKKLRRQLVRILAQLRTEKPSTPAGRNGKTLAIRGFAATLTGTESQIDFAENDRGNIEAATRDAIRADRALKRGANLLRAAGRAFGIRVGTLRGY